MTDRHETPRAGAMSPPVPRSRGGVRLAAALAAAIALDVTGTLALRAADGLTRPWWLAVMCVGYVGSLYFLSVATAAGLSIGVAYGVYSAVAVAATTVLGLVLFADRLTWVAGTGLVLVVAGVGLVNGGSAGGTRAADPERPR